VTTYKRRQTILETLRKQPGSRVSELALLFDVSEGTIRNDLDASSTANYLDLALESRNRLRIVTNVVRLQVKNASNTVIYVGGILSVD
jgi:DeoR/GlpR family transcriptional regulator of sugar metabolism